MRTKTKNNLFNWIFRKYTDMEVRRTEVVIEFPSVLIYKNPKFKHFFKKIDKIGVFSLLKNEKI